MPSQRSPARLMAPLFSGAWQHETPTALVDGAVPGLEELRVGDSVALPGRPSAERLQLGAVYTPDALALWTASLIRESAPRPVTAVLDPACGRGALLRACDTEIPDLTQLVGVDLSAAATQEVKDHWPQRAWVAAADTLQLTSHSLPDVQAVIMNPPWGAALNRSTTELARAGFELARGQYDSWDLFVEWTVRSMPPRTTVAAILPDALFLPEHEATRRLLIDKTDLRVVARLGEGWFKGVFRGVAVVIYVTGRAGEGPVRCIRLPHNARRRVLSGKLSLREACHGIETFADQAQWRSDDKAHFTPGALGSDVAHVRHIEERGGGWGDWVDVGRGVEIGKSGSLVRCGVCGTHRPTPRERRQVCPCCGAEANWTAIQAIRTSEPHTGGTWAPMIVGEDVGRYSVEPSRWIQLGLSGVNYKNLAVYGRQKLLVRKTGLGLNASVDTGGGVTNQVVFHYIARAGAPDFLLHYLEGVLCSRVMLALHLTRTGETEWRSHPYVTPKVLSNLPIPSPQTRGWNARQAQAIADAAQAVRLASPSNRPHAELHVDRLVAGLYGLDASACDWVGNVLSRTQKLQAFAHLSSDSETLRPEVAA